MTWSVLDFSQPNRIRISGTSPRDLRDALWFVGADALRHRYEIDVQVTPIAEVRRYMSAARGWQRWYPQWKPGELAAMSDWDRRGALIEFRGSAWADIAERWTPENIPPVVVVMDRAGEGKLGDGFGRLNYAIGMGWDSLPVAFLRPRA